MLIRRSRWNKAVLFLAQVSEIPEDLQAEAA